MNDTTGIVDGDTPVNPYTLVEAVKDASQTCHAGWLLFIAVMFYVMVAVAGVTHRDLLLEAPVSLPILQVSIPVVHFFEFAPVLLLLFHVGLLAQLALLARKALEFDHAVRALEPGSRRSHPLRLEVHSFFFVQAIAGPHRSVVMGALLRAISWLTLVILPVLLLVFVQIKFLPYHDVAITWLHRILIGVDIAVLVLIGVFLTRAEASFIGALFRTARRHPLSLMMTASLLVLVSLFSLFVATVPGEALDRVARTGDEPGAAVFGLGLPFVAASADGVLFGRFHRSLVVTDADLVADARVQPVETSLNLRGRELRHARLDRSDLHQADLTGADLSHASLTDADLRGIKFTCADISAVVYNEDRLAGGCGVAVRTNFARADLRGARLAGIDLGGARLDEVKAEGAEFNYADATGANFYQARLDRAEMSGGTRLRGANFLLASLQGADLSGAFAELADFSSAAMQSAGLRQAALEGADFRRADLSAADLSGARLFGARMAGAVLRGADLRWASLWMIDAAPEPVADLADATDARLQPPDPNDAKRLQALGTRINATLAGLAQERLSQGAAGDTAWLSSPSGAFFQRIAQLRRAPDTGYPRELTDFLAATMCKPRWSAGHLAFGIARRAGSAGFVGNAGTIDERLRADSCPGARAVPPHLLQQLAAAVDDAKD